MGVVAFVKRTPSAALLIAQLAGILAYPLMEESATGRAAFALFGIVVLGLAILVIQSTPVLSWVSILFAAPATVLLVAQVFTDNSTLFGWSSGFEAVIYFYAAFAMIAYMLEDTRVHLDELFAIGAVFTLLAWAFAYVYVALQAVQPASFVVDGGQVHSWMDLLFLSFTVLTGTGMSEILPLTGYAQSVVMIEQVVGLFYVAMVVTRLVALQAARERA